MSSIRLLTAIKCYFALRVSTAAADRASHLHCLQGWLGQAICPTRRGIPGHVPQVLQQSTSCIATKGLFLNKTMSTTSAYKQTSQAICCLPTAHDYHGHMSCKYLVISQMRAHKLLVHRDARQVLQAPSCACHHSIKLDV